ncbi:MAG: aspartate kinase [Deltaproteobacteria bacterium]|nr:aspartate kinase [Deltaproteobacteria bacterium]
MGIIVQKFGGTSVGTGERLRAVAEIISETRRNNPVIAVVSAMSGTVKAEGTTSLLLKASELALSGQEFASTLESIENNHLQALNVAVSNPDIQRDVGQFLKNELTQLGRFLEAVAVIRELSSRSQDILMATGEKLSARLLAATLEDMGTTSRFVDLGGVVPEQKHEVDPSFFYRLQGHLAKMCHPEGSEVPVVTGFFGMVPGGLLRTVGRGYTDFTASLISAGLGHNVAEEMQVWKEVDGIFTADPRRVPNARVLRQISSTEASELTYFGSEVLHPFTMERVVAANIPIRIKNTFNPESPGTVIRNDEKQQKRVTAVTAKRGITVISLSSNRMYNAYGFLARVFQGLADAGVVVDLVSTSEVSISFTIDREEDVEKALKVLEPLGTVSVNSGRAILAMVGEGMAYSVGTAGRMFSALASCGVNIEMISQGASEINISCVIKETDTETGLQVVHRDFMEEA